MRSISILLLFLRLTSARLNATKATDLLEQLVDTQVAFNENFNVQIITSSNGSYSSPIQREIFDELQQRNKWPMKHFGFRAFPGDFTLGVGLRNEIHVVLLSPLGLKQVLKWVSTGCSMRQFGVSKFFEMFTHIQGVPNVMNTIKPIKFCPYTLEHPVHNDYVFFVCSNPNALLTGIWQQSTLSRCFHLYW